MMRYLFVAFALAGMLICIGCGPDIQSYMYQPHPAVAALPSTRPQQEGPPLEVLATIVGIHHETTDRQSPLMVDVRLRVQNYCPSEVVIDPRSLELTNAQLVRFPAPKLNAAEPLPVRPDQPVTISALFPFPPDIAPDKLELNTLTLRWALDIDGQHVGQIVDFHRFIYRDYYYGPYYGGDPFYPYPYGYYGGVVIVRHR